jgi:hypothetical protein
MLAFQALTLIHHCNRPKNFRLRYNTFPQIKFGSNMGSNNLTWTSQNQTGVNKLQIPNPKSQTNYKLQCPNDQARLGFIELSSMIITSLPALLNIYPGILIGSPSRRLYEAETFIKNVTFESCCNDIILNDLIG